MTEAEWRKLPMKHRLTGIERRRLGQIIRALEFYADPDTYFACSLLCDPPCGPIRSDYSDTSPNPMGVRLGKRARRALRISYVLEDSTDIKACDAQK